MTSHPLNLILGLTYHSVFTLLSQFYSTKTFHIQARKTIHRFLEYNVSICRNIWWIYHHRTCSQKRHKTKQVGGTRIFRQHVLCLAYRKISADLLLQCIGILYSTIVLDTSSPSVHAPPSQPLTDPHESSQMPFEKA